MKRTQKIIRHYGEAEGYRYNNAIVAFGKEEPRNKKKDKQEKETPLKIWHNT